jgi:hypothetical protein
MGCRHTHDQRRHHVERQKQSSSTLNMRPAEIETTHLLNSELARRRPVDYENSLWLVWLKRSCWGAEKEEACVSKDGKRDQSLGCI